MDVLVDEAFEDVAVDLKAKKVLKTSKKITERLKLTSMMLLLPIISEFRFLVTA